jgi:hypothetical protein
MTPSEVKECEVLHYSNSPRTRVSLFAVPKTQSAFMSAHDEPLSFATRDLLALLAVVENGYD